MDRKLYGAEDRGCVSKDICTLGRMFDNDGISEEASDRFPWEWDKYLKGETV